MSYRSHKGVILDISKGGFDSGAATFASVFCDKEYSDEYFMFYIGAPVKKWSETSIGLATSKDGLNFKKFDKPILDAKDLYLREVATPVVWRVGNYLYMAFAGSPYGKGRRIMLTYSDDPKGPWKFLKVLAEPEYLWEGTDIDLGPSVARVSENEFLLYYSNVSNKLEERLFRPRWWFAPKFWLRRIGILKLKIKSPLNVEVSKFDGNPLRHLNGDKGSWNESLFCPGYLRMGGCHYLFTAASTYSTGFPYKQYIGLVIDSSPYFTKSSTVRILVDGPKEKFSIIPSIRGEIALDTPCPVLKDGFIYLYYAVMDRADEVWKTALSVFSISNK
ncbi:MAG: hypothetical protein QXG40_05880 [Ignisphaera sp.]